MNLTVVFIIIGVLGTASNILAVRMKLENCEKELKIITKITTNTEDGFWILRKKFYHFISSDKLQECVKKLSKCK